MHLLPVGIAALAFAHINVSFLSHHTNRMLELSVYAAIFALAISLQLALAYRHAAIKLYLFGMTLAFYPALLHLLGFFNADLNLYPLAIALLSLVLYIARKRIVGESGAGLMAAILLAILGITAVSPYFVAYSDASYYPFAWVAGYFFLLIFWHSRLIESRPVREYLLVGAIYLQYLMHIEFAQHFVNPIFTDVQWITGVLGLLVLGISMREAHFQNSKLPVPLVYLAAAIALLPGYYQTIITEQTSAYALLGILYSLVFVGVGILYRNSIVSGIGVFGVIVAVLIPMGEFILSQEWWVILLIVGLILIIAAVTLTTLRRNSKKKVVASEIEA